MTANPPSLAPDAWAEHVAAWRESKLTRAEYCRQHGLKLNLFLYGVVSRNRRNFRHPTRFRSWSEDAVVCQTTRKAHPDRPVNATNATGPKYLHAC